MIRSPARTGYLREDCLSEALLIIGEAGLEGLSLREVARRLGVSHQAPYKHFASRDHLLAEVIRRTFAEFADHLDNSQRSGNPHDDLAAMGRAYLAYARKHPLQYRLMFGSPLPDADAHPEMMQSAQHAFSLLRDCLQRMHSASMTEPPAGSAELDAMFVWSTMHGLASILETSAMATLNLPVGVIGATPSHVLDRIGMALETKAKGSDQRA